MFYKSLFVMRQQPQPLRMTHNEDLNIRSVHLITVEKMLLTATRENVLYPFLEMRLYCKCNSVRYSKNNNTQSKC